MNSLKHYNIHIAGKVQGVGFRYSARSMARMLNLTGFVKNMPNKSVYIEAEGKTDELNEYISWCRKGPEYAIVENVSYFEGAISGFTTFEIN
jgi:acylphosphatase